MKKPKICPQTNPGNCKYLNAPVCAFIRRDGKCKKGEKNKQGRYDK